MAPPHAPRTSHRRRGRDEPDGYVSYRRTKRDGEDPPPQRRKGRRSSGCRPPPPTRALWRFLLNTDLARRSPVHAGRVDEPLRWLLADPRRFRGSATSPTSCGFDSWTFPKPWARAAILPPGSLVVEVTESFPTPVTATYQLRADSGRFIAECTTTSEAPDLALDAKPRWPPPIWAGSASRHWHPLDGSAS